MSQWGNFVGYQLVWLAAVFGAGRGWVWPGVLVMTLFAAWQFAVNDLRVADARLAAVAVLAGLVVDGLLRARGILHYAAGAPALPAGGAPLWILALWVAFALTLNHSLRWLTGRTVLSLALGAVGGPLAYAAAARLGAVAFALPAWHGYLWLAAGWALAFGLLGGLAALWRGDTRAARSVPS